MTQQKNAPKNWTLFGVKLAKPRPNMSISAVAILFAAQTFVSEEGAYPVYMCILAWASAAWITWQGAKKKVLLSLTTGPISLLWLNPVLGGNWFESVGVEFMVTHSLLALVWAFCAYTFLATEKS